MNNLQEQIDEIEVWFDVNVGHSICPSDETIDNCKYGELKNLITSLIKSTCLEIIGDVEYRETEDMSLKTWSVEDLKAFGKNELRLSQREHLNKILGESK